MSGGPNWQEANQEYLVACLAGVRGVLERHAAAPRTAPASSQGEATSPTKVLQPPWTLPAPPALERLRQTFGLSGFERALLLLCAGMELDSSFASLCAAAQGDAQRSYPTFSLALAAFPSAHWSALSPAAPLRYWRLVEVGAGSTLASSPLRVDERTLHFLAGVDHVDERLAPLLESVVAPGELVASHRRVADRVAEVWSRGGASPAVLVVQLCGDDLPGCRAVAAAACAAVGLRLCVMSAQGVPLADAELDAFIRLWEREAALAGRVLLLECDELEADGARPLVVARLLERVRSLLLISSREPRRIRHRPTMICEVSKPTAGEQHALWEAALGSAASRANGGLHSLVSQFRLSAAAIGSVCAEAVGLPRAGEASEATNAPLAKQARDAAASSDATDLAGALWEACRGQARPRLEGLAQRIVPRETWQDLVLPDAQLRLLREIAAHVRQRAVVYERWGFAGKSSRGFGISALFVGPSGTGKTMAAEVLADELRLDLHRIDLSQVVSKYIGETEKNLRRVFDVAEEGGTILLFDEADALFGKRSEVKDSHDRYANIEISYLLQRMEAYRGLAILTSNMKDAVDSAFLRRIRFIVHFPFPDFAQRARIWQRIYPASTPTEGLELAKLARLNVAGGNIRSIALHAAFLAAERQEPVRMEHLLRAAQVEYTKLERSLTDAEIGGWL
ncbi:MAG: ATP-binding protein [Terriglobales bacterium]